jgi:hypothetical protein
MNLIKFYKILKSYIKKTTNFVVPIKWIECAELLPPKAELFVGGPDEATDIG